jgi:hypothetical protein
MLRGLDIQPVKILKSVLYHKENEIDLTKTYPIVVYYHKEYPLVIFYNFKPNPIDIAKGYNGVIYLPAPTEFSKQFSDWKRNHLLYNANLNTKELNFLQANRILSNIKNIIDKVNNLKKIKRKIGKFALPYLPYIIHSKLFYIYGEKGSEVLELLKKKVSKQFRFCRYFLLIGR